MVFSEYSRKLGRDPAEIAMMKEEEEAKRKKGKKIIPLGDKKEEKEYSLFKRIGSIIRRREKEEPSQEIKDNVIEVDFEKGEVIEEEKN